VNRRMLSVRTAPQSSRAAAANALDQTPALPPPADVPRDPALLPGGVALFFPRGSAIETPGSATIRRSGWLATIDSEPEAGATCVVTLALNPRCRGPGVRRRSTLAAPQRRLTRVPEGFSGGFYEAA
jgi:hypothetical protein